MNEIIFLTPDLSTELPLLYADAGIPAGFPSPAQDYVDGILDLNKELIQHPAATFYAKVVGDSMEPEINEGDLLIVDRSLDPFDDCIAVCCLNNEFTIKLTVKTLVTLFTLSPFLVYDFLFSFVPIITIFYLDF